jgi:hypothetical protein
MAKKKKIVFHISYKPHFFKYCCDVLEDEADIIDFSGFEQYSGVREHIGPIKSLLEILGHPCEITFDDNLAEIHEKYVQYYHLESDVTDRLFEEQPKKTKELIDRMRDL